MTGIANTSDEDLLCRSAAGDEEAFITLYRRRQVGIYRFALHMSGNRNVAEEVTQEVFLTVIREGDRFNAARGTAAAYLFGIARNHVLRLVNRNRPYVAMSDDQTPVTTDETPNPLAALTRAETILAVRQAVLSLPATYREAVVLCDLEEMSYADAADAMGVPIGTVRSRLNRGRSMLLEKLTSTGKAGRGIDVLRCFA